MTEIISRYSGAVLYTSESATTMAAATIEANLSRANLEGANLRGADGLPLGAALQLGGSRHWITVLSREDIRIGCHRNPLAKWLAIGTAEGYTPAEVAEYSEHLRHVERWIAAREGTVV